MSTPATPQPPRLEIGEGEYGYHAADKEDPEGQAWETTFTAGDNGTVVVHSFTTGRDLCVLTHVDAYNAITGESVSPDYPRAGVLSETPYPDVHAANSAAEAAARSITADTVLTLLASAAPAVAEEEQA